jgi:hypothetical protein
LRDAQQFCGGGAFLKLWFSSGGFILGQNRRGDQGHDCDQREEQFSTEHDLPFIQGFPGQKFFGAF